MDVFSAFPQAIISGVWQISTYQHGSLVGNVFDTENAISLDVIVDEGQATTINSGNNAQPIDADLLMYVQPDQMPVLNPSILVAGYMLYDSENDDYYAIVDASVGKNQETGEVEHIELLLKQTDIVGED